MKVRSNVACANSLPCAHPHFQGVVGDAVRVRDSSHTSLYENMGRTFERMVLPACSLGWGERCTESCEILDSQYWTRNAQLNRRIIESTSLELAVFDLPSRRLVLHSSKLESHSAFRNAIASKQVRC